MTGSINVNYYLKSKQPIPERLINDINNKTSLMMESGIHQFYRDFATFLRKLRSEMYIYYNSDDVQPITMQHMIIPLILLLCLLTLGAIVLAIEIIVHKYNMRRNLRISRTPRHS